MSKEIPLTQGKVAIVDDDMFDFLNQWKWTYLRPSYAGGSGYAYRQTVAGGKHTQIYMHRLILDAPKGKVVDHINHNGLDNRRENMRLATECENHYNARPRKNGTSKYKGVYYCSNQCRWSAEIHFDKKKKFLGYFESELAAATAYNQAATEIHGEFALLNNLDSHQEPSMPVRPKGQQSSTVRGVQYSKQKRKWVAYIKVSKSRIYLGSFATETEAAQARSEAEATYFKM